VDGWGRPLAYRLHGTQRAYVLVSLGRDGKPEADRYLPNGLPKPGEVMVTTTPDDDIIVAGPGPMFLRYPAGAIVE
jgi:hypothetical protein